MINDIKIIQGREGMFISMPSRKKKNGDYKDVAHPLNNETRGRIQERILAEYRQTVGDAAPSSAVEAADGRQNGPLPEDAPAVMSAAVAAPEPTIDDEEETPTAAMPRSATDDQAAEPEEEKTLDEVTERFSSESFWTA
jgi:hypothetical protein